MKNLLCISLLFCFFGSAFAQELSVDKKNNFKLDETILYHKELKELLKTNSIAFKSYRKGRFQYFGGGLLLLAGGGFVGHSVGVLSAGNDPNWRDFGIGAGMASLGILISKGYKKKYKKAVEHYNTPKKQKKTTITPSKKGIGLVIQF